MFFPQISKIDIRYFLIPLMLFAHSSDCEDFDIVVSPSAFYYQYTKRQDVKVSLSRLEKTKHGIIIVYDSHEKGKSDQKFLDSKDGKLLQFAFNIMLIDRSAFKSEFAFNEKVEEGIYIIDPSLNVLNESTKTRKDQSGSLIKGLFKDSKVDVPAKIIKACLLSIQLDSQSIKDESNESKIKEIKSLESSVRKKAKKALVDKLDEIDITFCKYLIDTDPEVRFAIWDIISEISSKVKRDPMKDFNIKEFVKKKRAGKGK